MRVLIVEDEPRLRQQLSDYLTQKSWLVDTAADGEEGLYQACEFAFDVAVIDLGLPKLDGISLIRQLRQTKNSLPILILTARDNWQDKVEGLEAGADDYLTKPFHNEELQARLNALLRRSTGNSSNHLEFGPIAIDTSAKTVSLNKQLLTLTQFEYNTLEYLALHCGEVISKTTLTEHLYQQDFDRDSNVIEVFIGRLRKKLDPTGDLKPIATVRGQGYRLTLEQKI
ncbi:MAG: response regulator transcription factor [Pseudomonadales bacterium]|nr:response regulator transcription factor [Pseudomonadales bacterium]